MVYSQIFMSLFADWGLHMNVFLLVVDCVFVVSGKLYGKFSGFSKHTLRSDVMNILEGCNVTSDDLKFSYMRGGNLNPAGV